MKTLQQWQEQSQKLSTDYKDLTPRERELLDKIIANEKHIKWPSQTQQL